MIGRVRLPTGNEKRRPTVWVLSSAFLFLAVVLYTTNDTPRVLLDIYGRYRSLEGASRPSESLTVSLIYPITASSPKFCRAYASAFAAGYSPATLVNWQGSISHTDGKILQMQKYLQSRRISQNELILVADAHDVFLQLPPQVLAQRYVSHDPGYPFFGAEKRCFPGPESDRCCSLQPHSRLPLDLYGSLTDEIGNKSHGARPWLGKEGDDPELWEYDPWERTRSRYINSGTQIGRHADLLKLYDAAIVSLQDLEDTRRHKFGSDQQPFMCAAVQPVRTGNPPLAAGDTESRLFQVMGRNFKEVASFPLEDAHLSPAERALARTQPFPYVRLHSNTLTRTTPVAVHFAGALKSPKGDEELSKLAQGWKEMWDADSDAGLQRLRELFTRLESDPDKYGAHLEDGTWLSWNELCAEHMDMLWNPSIPEPLPKS